VPEWVHEVISHRLHEPVVVSVDESRAPVETVEHTVIEVAQTQKLDALCSLLDERGKGSVIVFARTKSGVERLEWLLVGRGYRVAALQGNMGQAQRERVLRGFRRGNPPILVATNVAARGLDILSIEQVINFDVPDSAELLTHRLGRTGRMGRSGEAVTILGPRDKGKWKAIERELGAKIRCERWGADEKQRIERAPARPSQGEGEPVGRSSSRRRGRRTRHAVTCAACGCETSVSFVPRTDRPVYCAACFRERKESSAA
jgi:ATP-dependent RNA helicase DeaD